MIRLDLHNRQIGLGIGADELRVLDDAAVG
jgi:hypothetical protein